MDHDHHDDIHDPLSAVTLQVEAQGARATMRADQHDELLDEFKARVNLELIKNDDFQSKMTYITSKTHGTLRNNCLFGE